jgi:hypothetical protein
MRRSHGPSSGRKSGVSLRFLNSAVFIIAMNGTRPDDRLTPPVAAIGECALSVARLAVSGNHVHCLIRPVRVGSASTMGPNWGDTGRVTVTAVPGLSFR